MILARSTTTEAFSTITVPVTSITQLNFEVYLGTDLIYSGSKKNYSNDNLIEFDYSIFARDLLQAIFPLDVTGTTLDSSLFVSLGFAIEYTNGVDTFGALGIENAVYKNFVYGYFDGLQMVNSNNGFISYSDIVDNSTKYILMNEGTYEYLATGNAGGIWVDCLGTTATATYKGDGPTQVINLSDEFKGVPCVHPTFQNGGNELTITVASTIFGTNHTKTFYYKPITECKYTPIRVDFINNLGGWQRTWLFKASNETITQKREQFTRGFNRLRYIDGDSPTKMFNVETMKSIKGNTGWVDESFNTNTLEPLMNSETIFIDDKPVIIKTQSTELVKHINQKMINYTLEFDYAFNTIYK